MPELPGKLVKHTLLGLDPDILCCFRRSGKRTEISLFSLLSDADSTDLGTTLWEFLG